MEAWRQKSTTPTLRMAGPGVKNQLALLTLSGPTTRDIRPTLLSLVGLKDDYQSQGRVLAEDLHPWALPEGVEDSGDEFAELARAYKRINAPVGDLGLASLKISTAALAGDEDTYNNFENALQVITSFRNELADEMLERLTDAEFHGKHINGGKDRLLIQEANALADSVQLLAATVK